MRISLIMTAAAVALAASIGTPADARQDPPQLRVPFRSATTLVPVDVRVVDRQGRPVSDLKQEDFTVFEEGVRQNIRHFSLQTLTPEAPGAPGAPGVRKAEIEPLPSRGLPAQNSRVFLVVLGRGRLQEPSRGLDALMQFVRTRLLPQDRVAVLAWDRATDFTTDHDQVWQLIDRIRKAHERIEAAMAQQFGGLAAVYGSQSLPAWLRAEVTAVFKGTGALASRQVAPGTPADAAGLSDIQRRATDAAMEAELQAALAAMSSDAGIPAPPASSWSSGDQMLTDLPFDEFVSRNAGTMQDLSKIYAGIEYMRFVPGEKHLAFFTEQGLAILRGDDVSRLAEVANDARVVIDNFQTGGVTPGFGASAAMKDLRVLSEATGGQASIMEYSRDGLDRVDQATRVSYLLGYYPARPLGDGGYRTISVRVNRPGVTVLYRHGYFARLEEPGFDRRTFLTNNRVTSAALYKHDIHDIGVTLSASRVKGRGGATDEAVVQVVIDASRLDLKDVGGRHVGAIDVAVFFGDDRKAVVQERWQKIDLQLPEATYRRIRSGGLPYTLRMPI